MIATGSYMKVYGIVHNRIDKNGLTSKLLDYHSLEFGLVFGILLFFAGLVMGSGVILKWVESGYGSLSEVGTAVTSMTMAALGIQIIFSTLIISIFLLEEKDIQ